MLLTRYLLRGLFMALAMAVALPALAGGEYRVNKDADNVAILGYDPVAYFTEGGPAKGKSEFSHSWQDAKWHFANQEHRNLFAGDPERYAPRYGGYCAGGMAMGFILRIDPEAWVIIDEKLYLNYDESYTEEFVEDAPKEIQRADANWEKLGQLE